MSYIDLTITSNPSTPATNHAELFVSSSNKHLRTIDDTGTVLDFGGGTVNTGTSGQIAVYNGTNSITSGVTASMNSTKITSLANGTASTDAAAFGQIKVLQTVFNTTTTGTTTTSTTFVNATNATITITPTSASNRILLTVMGTCVTTGTEILQGTIFNGATDIFGGGSPGFQFGGGAVRSTVTCIIVDSPATTSAVTYQVKVLSVAGASVRYGNGQAINLIAQEIV